MRRKHPFDNPMDVLFPVPLDEYPESMRHTIVALRRSMFWRKLIRRTIASIYYVCLVCLLLVAAWFLAQVIDRDPPVRSTVEIITPLVAPGGQLKMRVVPYRLRLCETKVIFYAYDGEGSPKTVVMDWANPVGPIGPDKPFVRPITIPQDAVPGDARLRIERQFRCPFNLVHHLWPIVEISPDMPFTIVPTKGESK